MQQTEVFFENVHKNTCLPVFFIVIAIFKVDFCGFDIPVTEFIPEIFHHCACSIIITVTFKGFTCCFGCIIQAAVNPAVKFCQIRIFYRHKVTAFKISKQIAAGIPNFIAEAGTEFKRIFVNKNVLPLSAHKGKRKFQGI